MSLCAVLPCTSFKWQHDLSWHAKPGLYHNLYSSWLIVILLLPCCCIMPGMQLMSRT